MARPIGPRKIYRYSEAFRATAVRLSQLSGVTVDDVAQSLDVLPFLLSRWRRAAREGRLVTSKVKLDEAAKAELKELRQVKRAYARAHRRRAGNEPGRSDVRVLRYTIVAVASTKQHIE